MPYCSHFLEWCPTNDTILLLVPYLYCVPLIGQSWYWYPISIISIVTFPIVVFNIWCGLLNSSLTIFKALKMAVPCDFSHINHLQHLTIIPSLLAFNCTYFIMYLCVCAMPYKSQVRENINHLFKMYVILHKYRNIFIWKWRSLRITNVSTNENSSLFQADFKIAKNIKFTYFKHMDIKVNILEQFWKAKCWKLG